jgi:hypothetical protein
MDEELEPVFEAVERHELKFGVVPVFDGLFPKFGMIDWYVEQIEDAIRKNKPVNHSRHPSLNNPDIMID